MKVKDLIEILKNHDENNDVVFFHLKNHNLKQMNLESILDADNETEITITHEEVE
tara:strand:- start:951 stop:1115 length:165 start_codon:yes stop_codon:yes gene_type:complete